jgi:uncharacterized protein
MYVSAEVFYLEITDGITLKDKRQVVRSLLDRARSRFHVAAAEIAQLDSPRYATIAVVTVSNDETQNARVLEAVARMVEGETRAVVLERNVEHL